MAFTIWWTKVIPNDGSYFDSTLSDLPDRHNVSREESRYVPSHSPPVAISTVTGNHQLPVVLWKEFPLFHRPSETICGCGYVDLICGSVCRGHPGGRRCRSFAWTAPGFVLRTIRTTAEPVLIGRFVNMSQR